MKHIFNKKLIAVTIISICSIQNVYSADTFDKTKLIDAAKQIGQSTDFETFEDTLASESNETPVFVDNSTTSTIKEEAEPKAMGVLPTDASYKNRLTLYGKQKLVIHNPGENLKRSIATLTKVLAESPVHLSEEPINMESEFAEPFMNDEVLVKPMPSSMVSESSEPISAQSKLKESVSHLKSLFAAKVIDNSSEN